MSKYDAVKSNSIIVARIRSARMTEIERQQAFVALEQAEMLVDAIVWIAKKIEQFRARLFLKPALKHSLKH